MHWGIEGGRRGGACVALQVTMVNCRLTTSEKRSELFMFFNKNKSRDWAAKP